MAHFNPVEIEKSLKGIDFPASKGDLVNKAKENGASNDVVDMINKLADKKYNNPTEITKELGGGGREGNKNADEKSKDKGDNDGM